MGATSMDIRVKQKRNARNSDLAAQREKRALEAEQEKADRIAKNSARLKALRLSKVGGVKK
jgi:hypothetical protein